MHLSYLISDLHCDLLCYLSRDSRRSAYDLAVRCAIPQLTQGKVNMQIMAIFTETSHKSVENGRRQVEIFRNLTTLYPQIFEILHQEEQLDEIQTSPSIKILPAIENASSFCCEDEDLSQGLKNLSAFQKKMNSKIAYVSLTWNTENRFGGGAHTKIGLKEDGKRLIDFLSQKKIPIDLSHASDYLAYDILSYIDKQNISINTLASHSNLRSITNVPRNLPDDIAQEIWRRDGIVGLNFIRPFIGADSFCNFTRHLERALHLGGADGICFGADFFYGDDVSPPYRKPAEEIFFPSYDHAGCYPDVIRLWQKELNLSQEILMKISHQNLNRFIKTLLIASGPKMGQQ